MRYPSLVQIRGKVDGETVKSLAAKFEGLIEISEDGIDVFFDDVNKARMFLSRLKRIVRGEVRMSTRRKGSRVYFIYSFRPSTRK